MSDIKSRKRPREEDPNAKTISALIQLVGEVRQNSTQLSSVVDLLIKLFERQERRIERQERRIHDLEMDVARGTIATEVLRQTTSQGM